MESNIASMLANSTGTAGSASFRIRRSVGTSDASSSEVRTRMDGELPVPCIADLKIAGGAGWLGSCHRTSPTTPTISIPGLPGLRGLLEMRCPRGDSPRNAVRASVSLTMATCGESCVSVLAKSRPARTGISSVWKYPSVTS
ncbi:hypothetical protein D3C83_13740 [compost metagenome]